MIGGICGATGGSRAVTEAEAVHGALYHSAGRANFRCPSRRGSFRIDNDRGLGVGQAVPNEHNAIQHFMGKFYTPPQGFSRREFFTKIRELCTIVPALKWRYVRDVLLPRTSRISSTGQSGTFSPEHCATVLRNRRSSLARSAIFARMSSM